MSAIDPLLTARDVATLLGVHINTVKRIAVGDLPFYRVSKRGDRRYLQDDVNRFLKEREVTGPGLRLRGPYDLLTAQERRDLAVHFERDHRRRGRRMIRE